MPLLKTCSAGGCLTLLSPGTDRCAKHRLPKRGAQHRRASSLVMANATVCALCGGKPSKGDPLTADHIIPRALGGLSVPSNYQAVHLSCNCRKGAQIV